MARSRPIVVMPMWPGYTTVSSGQRLEQRRDRAHQRRVVAARQVGAADRALEQHVAGEDRVLGRDRVRHVAGRVPGREQDVDLQPGELEPLAAGDRVVGVVGLERAEARPRHVAHDVGQDRDLELGAPDLRAGRARQRRDRADVVEVRVREQDRRDLDAERLDRLEQPRRLVAGVDRRSPRRAPSSRAMWQFSCTGPTVKVRTSISASARPCAAGSGGRPCASGAPRTCGRPCSRAGRRSGTRRRTARSRSPPSGRSRRCRR